MPEQTVTARYAMPQYTGPRKSEAVPFLQKSSILLRICHCPLLNQHWLSTQPIAPHIPSPRHPSSCRLDLGGGKGLADAGTTLPGVEADLLTGNNSVGFLHNLLSLGEDQLDVAGVGHVGVDLRHGQSEKSWLRFSRWLRVTEPFFGEHIHDRGHGKFVGAAWGPG